MSQNSPEINSDFLRNKYRIERDKRLRTEGNSQYRALPKDIHIQNDPYITQPINRQPLEDTTDVVIIGGGFGGIIAAIELQKAGLHNSDIRIIEKGGDFGGTWYWNRYPGAACDIESYIYLPLLEETGYIPTEKYASSQEIYAYIRLLANKYNLYDNACLQTLATSITWLEDQQCWQISTSQGDKMHAKFIMMSNGPLHQPKVPNIAGVNSFTGHSFHTSLWDYNYTGGSSEGNLAKLKNKKIGVIGTGATAVQCVPHLAESAEQLYVFQRTPSSIDVRNNKPTDPTWANNLQPGWHQNRLENFNNLVTGLPEKEDLVSDGWTDIIRKLGMRVQADPEILKTGVSPQELLELADFEKMEQIRNRVDAIVEDPATAEKLKPWYRQFCKRPCFHDEYLQAYNKHNVTLVDTDGKGIDEIKPNGVVANGQLYEIDCLIYATGFVVGGNLETRIPGPHYEVIGRDQVKLSDYWKNGVQTFQGLMIRGFPNLFNLGSVQGGFTANYPHNLSEQAIHCSYILKGLRTNKIIEASEKAQNDWVALIEEKAKIPESFQAECTPGYYNNEGLPRPHSRKTTFYGGGSPEYFSILKQWRKKNDYLGLEIK